MQASVLKGVLSPRDSSPDFSLLMGYFEEEVIFNDLFGASGIVSIFK